MNLSYLQQNFCCTTPKKKKQYFKTYEKYMFFIGIVGQLLFYFQAYEIFSTRSSCSVSLPGFCISFIALTSWLIYGFLIKSKVMIVANIAGLIGCVWVLIGIMMY